MNIDQLTINLQEIPKEFTDNEGETYLLSGLIHFYGNEIPSSPTEIGHYTAFCYRGDTWIEYDGFKEKPTPRSNRSTVKPKILFYLRQM